MVLSVGLYLSLIVEKTLLLPFESLRWKTHTYSQIFTFKTYFSNMHCQCKSYTIMALIFNTMCIVQADEMFVICCMYYEPSFMVICLICKRTAYTSFILWLTKVWQHLDMFFFLLMGDRLNCGMCNYWCNRQ